ncbi:3647_t:CDS:2, partial [Funneliformis mosseae]
MTLMITHQLVSEVKKAFDVFIDSLNQYFDLIEDITNEDIESTFVKWYTHVTVRGTGIVQAKSNYYNASDFSNVVVNMNEKEVESYNTVDETYFAKLLMLFSLKISSYKEQELALVQ